jgi:hypothetical protein
MDQAVEKIDELQRYTRARNAHNQLKSAKNVQSSSKVDRYQMRISGQQWNPQFPSKAFC